MREISVVEAGRAGGLATKRRYGTDHYRRLGRMGGLARRPYPPRPRPLSPLVGAVLGAFALSAPAKKEPPIAKAPSVAEAGRRGGKAKRGTR